MTPEHDNMNLKNNLELKAWAILCQVADPEDPIAAGSAAGAG